MSWLLQIIGINSDVVQRLSQAHWLWMRPVVLIVGLILLVPAAWFIARRHRRSLPHISGLQRAVLTTCRVGVLAILIFVIGGPYLQIHDEVTQKPILAVLMDQSASMNLPAGTYPSDQLPALAEATGLAQPGKDGKVHLDAALRKTMNNLTRGELMQKLLAHQWPTVFAPLKQHFDLRIYRFARTTHPTAAPGDSAAKDKDGQAWQQDTALGGALRDVAAEAANRPIAAVVLLSDGQTTTGDDPRQVVERQQTLASKNEAPPIFAVPMGSEQPLADVSLVDVLAPTELAKGDNAVVVATLRSQGLAGRGADVQLLEGDKVLDHATVTLIDGQRQQTQLHYQADKAGSHLLHVRIEPLSGERIKANNTRPVTIDVDKSRWKVLYLEGYPRWDFCFLDHSLRRDRALDVHMVMEEQLEAVAQGTAKPDKKNPKAAAPADDLPRLAHLPQDAAGFAQYNAIMLGDITPKLLPPRLQEQLVKAVKEKGVGLIVEAGPKAMPQAFTHQPLAQILPIKLASNISGSGNVTGEGGVAAPAYAPFTMTITAAGAMHPALRLYDNASRNREVWRQMPAFYWAAGTVQAKPGATVLADLKTATGSRPLIAEQYVGRGRVMFLGLDSTYRWRRNIGDVLFYRFWGQALRYLARNQQRDAGTSWMEVYPHHVEPGGSVAIELHAVDGDGQPIHRPSVELDVVQGNTHQRITLEQAGQPGHFRGQWQSKTAGDFQFQYTAADGKTVRGNVSVGASGAELVHAQVNRDSLGTLAQISGGRLIEPGDLASLDKLVAGKPTTVHRVFEAELWDNWLVLVLLICLYCADVAVRRMAGVT